MRHDPLPIPRPAGVPLIFDPEIPGWAKKSWKQRFAYIDLMLFEQPAGPYRNWLQRLLERTIVDAFHNLALQIHPEDANRVPKTPEVLRTLPVETGFWHRMRTFMNPEKGWMLPVIRDGVIKAPFGNDGVHWSHLTWAERFDLADAYYTDGYEAIGPGYGRELRDRFIVDAWFDGALAPHVRFNAVDVPTQKNRSSRLPVFRSAACQAA